ncbi:hypothetical protein ABL78_6590 [Leptomonas seymouri]|uniref:Uncharacterized protein n=1 Tax=Leptomonas seymouri TaxID=5684 RepID=A0A0N1HV62_LEPSE|nr:hypothetical protein ABL78_6590 [Leptomonas seymouri]|eukprot:KPI84361.1 hypothetical protein ABL78_6590 [Leptomonas seymouri]
MGFRGVKPPMPTLRLPEDYLYNPLYFVAGTPPHAVVTVAGPEGVASPAHDVRDTTHATLPSSTYLHRPLRFVSPSPHGTPQRQHSRLGVGTSTSEPRTPLSTPQTPRRRLSAHSGNTSLIRQAHALVQEVAGWQRDRATMEKENEVEAHSEPFNTSEADRSGSAHRPTRAAQLRAHHIYERLGEREEAEHNIFYSPKYRPSPVASMKSPRLPARATKSSTPHRQQTTASIHTPRSTKATELRQRHCALLIEEMEERRRLRLEDERKDEDGEHRCASPRSVPAQLPASRRSEKARGLKSTAVAQVQSQNEERHRRKIASNGQDGGVAYAGAATPTRRRGSVAKTSSREQMKAAVLTYLDERERNSEEVVVAPTLVERKAAREDEELDAPAALPAPKPRKRGEVVPPPVPSSEKSPPRLRRAEEGAVPPSPEPRPPPPRVSPTASAPADAPSASSTAYTTQLPQQQRAARGAISRAPQSFSNPAKEGKPVVADDVSMTQAALAMDPSPEDPTRAAETAVNMKSASDSASLLPTVKRDTKPRSSSPVSTPLSLACSSIDFSVATSSQARRSATLSASAAHAPQAEVNAHEDSLHGAEADGVRQTHLASKDAVSTSVTLCKDLTSGGAASKKNSLSCDSNEVAGFAARGPRAQASASLASNRIPSAPARKHPPATAVVEVAAPEPSPALSKPSRREDTQKANPPLAAAGGAVADSSADPLSAAVGRSGAPHLKPAKDVEGDKTATDRRAVPSVCGAVHDIRVDDAAPVAEAEATHTTSEKPKAASSAQRPQRPTSAQAPSAWPMPAHKATPSEHGSPQRNGGVGQQQADLNDQRRALPRGEVGAAQPAENVQSTDGEETPAPADEAAVSQSFSSIDSLHSGEDALLHPAVDPTHCMPAAHPFPVALAPSADAAATQAELLRYYRSEKIDSASAVRLVASLYLPAALPTPTIPADDVGAAAAGLQSHTAVGEIVGTSGAGEAGESSSTIVSTPYHVSVRTATSTRSTSRVTRRSSVSTVPTSSAYQDDNSHSVIERQNLCQHYFKAWLSSLPLEKREGVADTYKTDNPSPPSATFMSDVEEDFSYFRGMVMPSVADSRASLRGRSTQELFTCGGLRAWGLPVPPTNHTHAVAAWTALQCSPVIGGHTTESSASSRSPCELHRKAKKPFAADSLPPPYQPRMEGPVWKDALDTLRLPHLQESNCPSQPTPPVTMSTAKEGVECFGLAASATDIAMPSTSEVEMKPAAPLKSAEAVKEKADEAAKGAITNDSEASINSIPTSTSRRPMDQPLTIVSNPSRTSRLPARTREARKKLSLPAEQPASTAEASSPQTSQNCTAIPTWVRQSPCTVGVAEQHQSSPSLSAEEADTSVRSALHVSPVGAALSQSEQLKEGSDSRAASTAPVSPNTAAAKLQEAPVSAALPSPVSVAAESPPSSSPTTLAPASTSRQTSSTANGAAPPLVAEDVSPEAKKETEKSSREEGVSSASLSSFSSPTASEVSSKQLTKYALWKARQETRRQAAGAAEAAASPPSAEALTEARERPAETEQGSPTQSDSLAVTRRAVEDRAHAHLGFSASTASPSAHSPDATSALASTVHTVFGWQSMGGTEAERTPMERSECRPGADVSEDEMGEGEGTKVPLSHAPTPMILRSPPRNVAAPSLERAAAVGAAVGASFIQAVEIAAAATESRSSVFSRSETSTQSLASARADVQTSGPAAATAAAAMTAHAVARENAGGTVGHALWMPQTAEPSSPASMCKGDDNGVAADASGSVGDERAAMAAEPCGVLMGGSPPASMEVTLVHEALQFSSSSEGSGTLLPTQAPLERDLYAAIEEAAVGSGGRSSCRWERAGDPVTVAGTSPSLFSCDSSSLASSPVRPSTSPSTSLTHVDGGAASVVTPWSTEKRSPETTDIGRREDEESGVALHQPQEPAPPHAPLPRSVASAAPAVTAPRRTSQATAADDEVVASPYRPRTPLPNSNIQAAPSLSPENKLLSGSSSPERMWEGAAATSAPPSMAEEGLEVLREGAQPSAEAPVSQVQYIHQDM